ncbi:MAG: NAD(P)H-hydrate dehydratase [Gammaproteobacteria bacterium]|nr:NAD(P)H-hydrate dehydratase [Gammaproteobacteria bacterium]
MQNSSTLLYQVGQIRKLEEAAIKKFGISVDVLMQQAGKAAFYELKKQWPKARNIVVVCGKGNNAGDGYVVARLAKMAKFKVRILQVVSYDDLSGAAKRAALKCQKLKIKAKPFDAKELVGADVIVDAILGTGLAGIVSVKFKKVIKAINASKIQILSLDVPSGIDADTGNVLGEAIRATTTITFIGYKIGLYIGQARDYCGNIVRSDLGLSKKLFQGIDAYAQKLDLTQEIKPLMPRKRTAHKGDFGHVLVIGGDYGMGGAVRMAAEAAFRVGAGLVTVATRPKNALVINGVCPEIMAYGISTAKQLQPLLYKAGVIVIGPGLGQSHWAKSLFNMALESKKSMVVDADALNILSSNCKCKENWILTPHPKEAARLLGTETAKIQSDRLQALQKMQKEFGGVCILKGAGTLIAVADERIRVCDAGNPGMASAGMGDVLSGMIAGLVAQGLSLFDGAKLAVLLHAMAGDLVAAKHGKLGIMAMDLLPEVRSILADPLVVKFI